MLCCFFLATVLIFVLLKATHIPQHCKGNTLLHFCAETCNIYVVDDIHAYYAVLTFCVCCLLFIHKQNLNEFLTSGILKCDGSIQFRVMHLFLW